MTKTGAHGAVGKKCTASQPASTGVAFWDRFAFAYDAATRSGDAGLDQAAAYVSRFVGRHGVVLDAACGTGAFACRLAPHAGFVAASDLSPKMIARAEAKARRMGLSNMAFGTGDVCALDFADGTFDLVVAGNVLHLLDNPEKALSELARVTRPGGTIALPTYVNAEDTDRRFLKLIGAAGFAPKREWDERGYLAFLAQCGMDVTEHRSFSAKQPLCVAICHICN